MPRLTSLALVLVLVAACGSTSKPSPAAAAAPAPTGSATAPACPDDVATLVGTPCPAENATCGADAARKATGFSNVVVCRNGTWAQVEVPPPPPPPPPGGSP
jgi:hypothetical protein